MLFLINMCLLSPVGYLLSKFYPTWRGRLGLMAGSALGGAIAQLIMPPAHPSAYVFVLGMLGNAGGIAAGCLLRDIREGRLCFRTRQAPARVTPPTYMGVPMDQLEDAPESQDSGPRPRAHAYSGHMIPLTKK